MAFLTFIFRYFFFFFFFLPLSYFTPKRERKFCFEKCFQHLAFLIYFLNCLRSQRSADDLMTPNPHIPRPDAILIQEQYYKWWKQPQAGRRLSACTCARVCVYAGVCVKTTVQVAHKYAVVCWWDVAGQHLNLFISGLNCVGTWRQPSTAPRGTHTSPPSCFERNIGT